MSLKKEWKKLWKKILAYLGISKEKEEDATSPAPSGPALNWCWGGFNGSKAKESDKARIKNLKLTSSGMSYSWESGGCEDLGASSEDDHTHTLACLFLQDGRGGKFDWISTSRRTRSFHNIDEGYCGWSKSAFDASKKVWFCICSKDGKRRTNLISADK